jgi:hypothetical protein
MQEPYQVRCWLAAVRAAAAIGTGCRQLQYLEEVWLSVRLRQAEQQQRSQQWEHLPSSWCCCCGDVLLHWFAYFLQACTWCLFLTRPLVPQPHTVSG